MREDSVANGRRSTPDVVRKADVTHYHRKPLPHGNFSLEGYFDTVRAHLGRTTAVTALTVPFVSRGAWRRLANLLYCGVRRRGLHHVTGDIHYVTLLLPKGRTVLTILDCAFESDPHWLRRELRRLLWYVLPVRRCAVVTVISEFTRTRLLAHIRCDPRKVRVVPVCISPMFSRLDRPFNAAKPRILQLGTTENKNLERLCVALSGVPCHLHIIGRLSEKQEAMLGRENIEYSNSCNLSSREVVRAYENCDMVTLVSTYEGFGMPIIEANTVGRPVVTSNIAAMPEVAADAACLVDPFNPSAIRKGVERVIEDAAYRQELIDKGYRNALRFSEARVAGLYEEIYADLMATSHDTGTDGEPLPVESREMIS